MNFDKKSPFSHGMEVEQPRSRVSRAVNDDNSSLNWHRDGSGPMECDIGPNKFAKSIVNKFLRETRDRTGSWNWTAYGSNACGSHVHFHLEAPEDATHEETVEAWTIAYNSIIELTPIFAPFFCHNWEKGFRNGVRGDYYIRRWASVNLDRYSQSSIESRVLGHGRPSRNYNAVTLNPSRDNKPVTIELRLNDAHPAMAMYGVTAMRAVIRRCIERGYSPKIENRRGVMSRMYNFIYTVAAQDELNLIDAMKQELSIVFEEGRDIPGANGREFDSMWDCLDSILTSLSTDNGTWAHRVKQLVKTGDVENSPHVNEAGLWHIDAPRGDFEWTTASDLNTE